MKIYTVPLVLFFAAITFFLPLAWAQKSPPTESYTRVRTMGQPVVTTETRYGISRIATISVEVRNVGATTAEMVHIRATLPDGNIVALSGPSQLSSNQTASYSASPRAIITKNGPVSISAGCGNCRRD